MEPSVTTRQLGQIQTNRLREGKTRMKTKEPQGRYFQMHFYMMNTDAWLALSSDARAVYLQIGFRYNGENNGKLAYSVRQAAKECNIARDTASRCFRELIDLGFIEETRHGGLRRKTRMASESRCLTAFRCDRTGTPKTCLFMQRGAQAPGQSLAAKTIATKPSAASSATADQGLQPAHNAASGWSPLWRTKKFCSEPCRK